MYLAGLCKCGAPLCLKTYSIHQIAVSSGFMGWSFTISFKCFIFSWYLKKENNQSNKSILNPKYSIYLELFNTSKMLAVKTSFVNFSKSSSTAAPRATSFLTLVYWSPKNGIPIIGTSKAIASSIDWRPPWVMNSFKLGCPKHKCLL